MIRFNTVISTKAYIFLWRNVETGHKLNTIKLTVTNCSKYVSKDKAGKCAYCKSIIIGIYRFTETTAGNVIWLTLREAQHLVHVLIEFIDLVTKLYCDNYWEEYEWIIKSRRQSRILDTNLTPSEVTFVPTDFSEATLKKESTHSDKEEPELDYDAVLTNRYRTFDRKSKLEKNKLCVCQPLRSRNPRTLLC
jgi:hypothetical protein